MAITAVGYLIFTVCSVALLLPFFFFCVYDIVSVLVVMSKGLICYSSKFQFHKSVCACSPKLDFLIRGCGAPITVVCFGELGLLHFISFRSFGACRCCSIIRHRCSA